MPTTSLAYRTLVRCGIVAARALSPWRPKLRVGLAGRARLAERMSDWSRANRDGARPLLWMHAASVGEGLQAQAVLQRLRQAHPEWQIVYTFFSPSAAEPAREQPADFADYLPLDSAEMVGAALEAIRPSALVFSKLDLWPELACQAAARGVAVGIIAATVSPRARRLRWPARALLRPGYASVAAAGAVHEADAPRLVRLGILEQRVTLTGDPRCDSALERARAVAADDPLLAWSRSGRTLVAGSTWPDDEDRLLAAFQLVHSRDAHARLLLVPHEPSGRHLARLERAARRQGFAPVRLPDARAAEPLLVVAETGLLARLYAGGHAGYVGGGYGKRLHSLLEPAACGVPVLFGPSWQGSPDAAALLAARGAAVVEDPLPDWLAPLPSPNPLAALWLALLGQPAAARAAGERARKYVEAGTGAADRNAALVERLMRSVTADGR